MRDEEVGSIAEIVHHTLACVPIDTQLIDDLGRQYGEDAVLVGQQRILKTYSQSHIEICDAHVKIEPTLQAHNTVIHVPCGKGQREWDW